MVTALKFALVGFAAGLAAALAMTAIGNQRPLSSAELHFFWPTALAGVEFTDWSDGNFWHFLRLLLVFGGNGVVYALVAASFGALIALARK